MKKINVKKLAKKLEEQGEIVFEYNETTVAIWETDQGDENVLGEDHLNYMFNLYDSDEFKSDNESTEEYDGGLCTGLSIDAIKMAIDCVYDAPKEESLFPDNNEEVATNSMKM